MGASMAPTGLPSVSRLWGSHEQPTDLVPRDAPTLEKLLHSAHAHCDLFHRLGEFCASRAVAKLIRVLDGYHELPLLETDRKFGSCSLSSSAGAAGGSLDHGPPPPVMEEEGVPAWARGQ